MLAASACGPCTCQQRQTHTTETHTHVCFAVLALLCSSNERLTVCSRCGESIALTLVQLNLTSRHVTGAGRLCSVVHTPALPVAHLIVKSMPLLRSQEPGRQWAVGHHHLHTTAVDAQVRLARDAGMTQHHYTVTCVPTEPHSCQASSCCRVGTGQSSNSQAGYEARGLEKIRAPVVWPRAAADWRPALAVTPQTAAGSSKLPLSGCKLQLPLIDCKLCSRCWFRTS